MYQLTNKQRWLLLPVVLAFCAIGKVRELVQRIEQIYVEYTE